jgi:hypothetical protein
VPVSIALELTSPQTHPGAVSPFSRWSDAGASPAPTAAERVLAAELQARGATNDALSMMVTSMARMVQVGRSSDSRWNAS